MTPFMLASIFVLNTLLALHKEQIFLWLVQILFSGFALVGWIFARKGQSGGLFGYAFSFCLANVGFLLGILKAVRNQRIVVY
jgi:hypothetical protein